MIDRLITAGFVLTAVFLATLAAAGAANAGTRDHEPATRSYVAKVLVERALLADVTPRDRKGYWQGTECFGDLHGITRTQRRRICYVAAMGFMRGYDVTPYPEFGARDRVRRDQMASVAWRLATYGEDKLPDHAASFIDVNRRSPHADAVRWGAYHGILRGYPGNPATFKPAQPVTRRQVRVIVDRVTRYWATAGRTDR